MPARDADHGPVFGGRPTLLGHRGMGREDVDGLAENSLESIVAAAHTGLRWVEFDVRRTADDALVVGHYPTIADRDFLADLTLEQARELGAVTLAEVLTALPEGVGVNLDLKTAMEDALRPRETTTAGLVAPVAAAERGRRSVLVSSFDPSALVVLEEVAPGTPRALLTWVAFPLRKAIPAAAHLGVEVVAAHSSSFGANPVDRAPTFRSAAYAVEVAHRAGLEVVAWCPPAPEARELLAAGVDAVVVDDVPHSLAALRDVAD
ncbi:glycerophosphoryl diester phosphodiesterase [Pedococcus dokdonensis]|uniref:Glycerophosphoryl diester phosphodiesterase n=1 Tax=Pedococcus dokdonensis TaxID=443156 RepID=A0A1H0TH30_9MICO|nr:glycerophosphodiester phosphodiesterase [Pedococcus dokdonensis]SDP53353.1 glycerophosphoryl diester phosphodiesterase [Pedococcus dokdonensis]